MLEKWKHAVDNKKVFGALLTYSSKAFDCIYHDLLIAKLNAYDLSLAALRLVYNYLQSRKQRTKNGTVYSLWEEIFSGVYSSKSDKWFKKKSLLKVGRQKS